VTQRASLVDDERIRTAGSNAIGLESVARDLRDTSNRVGSSLVSVEKAVAEIIERTFVRSKTTRLRVVESGRFESKEASERLARLGTAWGSMCVGGGYFNYCPVALN